MKGYSGKNIDLPLESAATTMRLLILISLIGLTLLSKAETLLKEDMIISVKIGFSNPKKLMQL